MKEIQIRIVSAPGEGKSTLLQIIANALHKEGIAWDHYCERIDCPVVIEEFQKERISKIKEDGLKVLIQEITVYKDGKRK